MGNHLETMVAVWWWVFVCVCVWWCWWWWCVWWWVWVWVCASNACCLRRVPSSTSKQSHAPLELEEATSCSSLFLAHSHCHALPYHTLVP